MYGHSEIVARRKCAPRNLPRKTAFRLSPEAKFLDAEHWNALALKHLPHYDLPAWDVPTDPEAMGRWLDRLGITLKQYLLATGLRNLMDFVELNPRWPLRAFIGLAIEMRNEGGF